MRLDHHELRLPIQKLSRRADRKIRKRLKQAARKEGGVLLFSPLALTALLLIVALPLSTFGVRHYAYASPSVTPDTALYTLKRSIEKKKLSKIISSSARAQYYLTLSGRRLDEADALLTHKPHLASIITVAQATEPEDGTVSLSVDKSLVGGLIVEGSQFVSLSIAEANGISDKAVRDAVLSDAKRAIERNVRTLEKIETKVPAEKPALRELSDDVQQVQVRNRTLVEEVVSLEEESGDIPKPLWIDLPDEEDSFLEHFEDVFDWEEDWEDELEEDHYVPWEEEWEEDWEEGWSDDEEWFDHWEEEEDFEDWLDEELQEEQWEEEELPEVWENEGYIEEDSWEEEWDEDYYPEDEDEWMEEEDWMDEEDEGVID